MNRKHRKQLATIIRQYLADEISAFKFDDLLDPYRKSDDITVSEVALLVWFHYDDCKDHQVILTKPEWGYFQRLLLVLDSNDHVVKTTDVQWRSSQLAALVSLVVFGFTVFHFGFGIYLLLITIPLGFLSLLISWLRNRHDPIPAYNNILNPFSTFIELKATYDAVPEFRKTRYPNELSTRRIRSATMYHLGSVPAYCMWVVFSPLFLFFQIFPTIQAHTRVVAT